MAILRTRDVDVLRIGWTFLHFRGDLDKTAVVARTTADVVRQLATEHGWDDRIAEIDRAQQGGPEEAKQVNRTINLIQAQRLRDILDRVVSHLQDAEDDTFSSFFESVDKKGNVIPNSKALTDLTKAAETIHHLTYAALGDGKAATEANASGDAIEIALAVANGLSRLAEKMPDRSAIPVVSEVIQ